MNDRLLLIVYEAYCKSRGQLWLEPDPATLDGFKVWLKHQIDRNLEPFEEAGLPELRKVLAE